MPKIRMLTSAAGLTFSYGCGEVVDIAESTANEWCALGMAELVADPKPAPAKKTASRRPAAKK